MDVKRIRYPYYHFEQRAPQTPYLDDLTTCQCRCRNKKIEESVSTHERGTSQPAEAVAYFRCKSHLRHHLLPRFLN